MKNRKPEFYYIIGFGVFLFTETWIALFVNDEFIRPYLGDTLATILVYCLIMSLSRFDYRTGIMISLLFSYLVEIAQYLELIYLLRLGDFKLARIILGTSFSWVDMLMYSVGALFIYAIEKFTKSKEQT
ncbi:MAG: DUF2809 domain-containing protein [Nonlabens sp.]